MTIPARRSLGTGPRLPIRATEADLVQALPGIGFPDLDGLRARGALGPQPAAAAQRTRRALNIKPSPSDREEPPAP
ncbi:hypothetical protein ACFRFJ_21250 [Streptomyces hydrogenans]|uniref:hypothetical protein n=1 Tax=Streptomyces hydrogenans TaxID=1873719 RepID=UPI0036C1F4E3